MNKVRWSVTIGLALALGWLASCRAPSSSPPTQQQLFTPTLVEVPLTFTPLPGAISATAAPLQTRPPQPTAVLETPIAFSDTAVELRYMIPALGLDRRLQGTVASQLLLIDESTGRGQQRQNQAGILLQLQQSVRDLELPALPEECDRCVHFSFELPLAEKSAAGWLQDPVLLASIENFTTAALGAHFPPGTILGLRRSASPYAPAQSLALTADGRLWVWQANQGEIPKPEHAPPDLLTALQTVQHLDLAPEYVASCSGVPIETLLLVRGEVEQRLEVVCPEYALPASLTTLYAQLDALMNTRLTGALSRPPAGFPLTALLDYQRSDGARLTLYQDGTAVGVESSGVMFTTTLSVNQVISLTNSLIEGGVVRPGLTTFTDASGDAVAPAANLLLVREFDAVYDGKWTGPSQMPIIVELNALLNTIIERATQPPAETAVPQPTPTGAP